MNKRGQAFTIFRFLVEAIIALAVLLIIIAIIGHFEERKIEVSKKRFFDGFRSAFQSPNGDTIERTDLAFESGFAITAGAFARDVRMPAECIGFIAPVSSAFSMPDVQAIKFHQSITTNVFYRCLKQFGAACEIVCEVSIAQPFR